MPPTIANGRYQILPWKRSFTSSTSRMWNLNGSSTWPSSSSTLVPVYSSAVYSCFRGYMLTSGSSLISCSPGGWWQPTHNSPQCVPYGSSASSGSSATSGNHYAAGGRQDPKEKSMLGQHEDDDDDDEEQPPDPFLVSFTTACGVTFVLCLIWIASRWTLTCIRSRSRSSQEALDSVCHTVPSAPPISTASLIRHQRHQRSLWTWMNPRADRPAVHQLDDDSSPVYNRQLDRSQSTDQDRMALIAYMNDSNTSSQATLPSYEEAVRTGTSSIRTNSVYCSWPVAPPSYDSILILNESSVGNAASHPTQTSPTSLSFVGSDEAVADSVLGTTTSSEGDDGADNEEDRNEVNVDADTIQGSRETLLLVPSATLDTDAITTFPAWQ